MTSRVDSGMPAQVVENTLQLGEVTFQGRTYIAILHYCGEDGEELEITDSMKAAQTAYCQAVQAILVQAGRESPEETSDILLSRVSTGGFIFAQEEDDALLVPTHRQLKTEEAWNRFIYSLHCPELGLAGRSHVELEDITDLRNRQAEVCRTIDQKLKDADENSPINFNDDEKRFLRSARFSNLSRGCYDASEVALFCSTMM